MFRRKLACSFCQRSEAEVAKLVAGPRVYICDRCAAEASRIMNDSDHTKFSPTASRGAILERLHDWWRQVGRPGSRLSAASGR